MILPADRGYSALKVLALISSPEPLSASMKILPLTIYISESTSVPLLKTIAPGAKLAAVICNFCISFSVNSWATGISLSKNETGILRFFIAVGFLGLDKWEIRFIIARSLLGRFFLKNIPEHNDGKFLY